MSLIEIVCPKCGEKLEIEEDTSLLELECKYCGSKYSVQDALNLSDSMKKEETFEQKERKKYFNLAMQEYEKEDFKTACSLFEKSRCYTKVKVKEDLFIALCNSYEAIDNKVFLKRKKVLKAYQEVLSKINNLTNVNRRKEEYSFVNEYVMKYIDDLLELHSHSIFNLSFVKNILVFNKPFKEFDNNESFQYLKDKYEPYKNLTIVFVTAVILIIGIIVGFIIYACIKK